MVVIIMILMDHDNDDNDNNDNDNTTDRLSLYPDRGYSLPRILPMALVTGSE